MQPPAPDESTVSLHPIVLQVNAPSNMLFYRHSVAGDGKCLLHAIAFLVSDQLSPVSGHLTMDTPPTDACTTAADRLLHQLIAYLTYERWQLHIMPDLLFDIVERMRHVLAENMSDTELDKVFANLPIEPRTFNASIAQHFVQFSVPTSIITQYLERTERQLYDEYVRHLKHGRITAMGVREMQCIAEMLQINIIAFDASQHLFAENAVRMAWSHTICLYNAHDHWDPIVIGVSIVAPVDSPGIGGDVQYYRSLMTQWIRNWGISIDFY